MTSENTNQEGRRRRRRSRRGRGKNRNKNNENAPRQQQQKQKKKLSLDELTARMSDYTAIQPNERINLEQGPTDKVGRIVNLVTPIGKGQRCLVTSPPKAGKTTVLQSIAKAVHKNHPEIKQIALLVDERPEEATDFRRNVPVEVIASTSDQPPKKHVKLAERVFQEAIQRMLDGEDVLVLLDSITRLARAYNVMAGSGKILSGGITAGALDRPRQLFGAARKLEEGGSLTIVGTALVDTGSLMDEVIFQEFKGTGNMELILDRELAQRRLFPAVNVNPSGTRRELELLDEIEKIKVPALRRQLADMGKEESLNWLLKRVRKTDSNRELLGSINTSLR